MEGKMSKVWPVGAVAAVLSNLTVEVLDNVGNTELMDRVDCRVTKEENFDGL